MGGVDLNTARPKKKKDKAGKRKRRRISSENAEGDR